MKVPTCLAADQYLFFSARVQGDIDVDCGPDALLVPVPSEERIERLQQLCSDEGVSEVRELFDGDWVSLSGEHPRTDLGELVVTGSAFWFACCLKNTDVHYEREPLPLEKLTDTLHDNAGRSVIPAGDESDLLAGVNAVAD